MNWLKWIIVALIATVGALLVSLLVPSKTEIVYREPLKTAGGDTAGQTPGINPLAGLPELPEGVRYELVKGADGKYAPKVVKIETPKDTANAADTEKELAALSADDRIKIIKANAEVKLEADKLAAEKEIKLAELKVRSDTPKAPWSERLAMLKGKEMAIGGQREFSAPTPAPQPTMIGAAPGYVVLDGKLVRKDELVNPVHCSEGRCGTSATPPPMPPTPVQQNHVKRVSNRFELNFAPVFVLNGSPGRGHCQEQYCRTSQTRRPPIQDLRRCRPRRR